MDIISRKDASKNGRSKYYTGRTCIHGHDAPRYVSTGACTKCADNNVRNYQRKLRQNTRDARVHGIGKLESVSFRVHPLDIPALRELVEAINLARSLMPPPPPPVMPPPPHTAIAGYKAPPPQDDEPIYTELEDGSLIRMNRDGTLWNGTG